MIGTYRLSGRASLRLDAESVRHHSPGSAKRRRREAPPWVLIPIRDFDPEGVAQGFVEPLQDSLPDRALSTQGALRGPGLWCGTALRFTPCCLPRPFLHCGNV